MTRKHMQRKTQITAILLSIIICLTTTTSYAKKKEGGMPPAAVETTTVQMQPWQSEVSAVGSLSPNQGVTIKTEVDGRITGLYFRSGDDVKAGAPLVQMNPSILQAQLGSAKAKLVLSKANYDRAQQLFTKRVFAQADLDNARSAYQSDVANVANAQALLDQTFIRAPFTGRLGLRMVDLGDFVKSGDSITTLNAIDTLRVDFRVPEVYLGRLALGQAVVIHSSAYPKDVFQGKIYAMDSQIDPSTRSLGIRASIPNKNYKLLPGGSVEVDVKTGAPQNWIGVPDAAILFDAQGPYVFRVINNAAVKTALTVGPRKNGIAAALTGLKPGDVIVTSGAFKLTDGAPVMVVPPEKK